MLAYAVAIVLRSSAADSASAPAASNYNRIFTYKHPSALTLGSFALYDGDSGVIAGKRIDALLQLRSVHVSEGAEGGQ